MKIHRVLVRSCLVLAALLPADGMSRDAPRVALAAAAPATAAKLAADTQADPANPSVASAASAAPDFGFADLMNMLIQPRHIKLYYAATSRNWELAAAEARNLRAGLARVSQRVPKYLGNDVADVVRLMFEPRLQAVDKAIAAGDSKRFATTFTELTVACNECHVYMEHPFVVIKVPEAAGADAFADQDFRASP